MSAFFKKLFSKSTDEQYVIDDSKRYKFTLKIDKLPVGHLEIKDGSWFFKYSQEFRDQEHYRRLIGFSDLNKEYKSSELWPFFKVRIPGLKQPMIQEIMQKENLDKNNEAMLLRRFGARTMTNPYILETS
jgi:HipA-like protein